MPRAPAMEQLHQRQPGITRRALARGRDAAGRSSYALLAELVTPGSRVLDLGCGDGVLLELVASRGGVGVGIDCSAAELALARQAGATVVRAEAAALPLRAGSFDLVLSHLAFSVMDDAEAVVAQIDRVLAAPGCFAAVVGGGPALPASTGRQPDRQIDGEPDRQDQPTEDGFEVFLSLLGEALTGRARCRLGDRRAGRPEGWRALWHARGYQVTWERHAIDLSGTLDEVWLTLASAYDMTLLSPEQTQGLARRFAEECGRRFAERIPVTMVVWRAMAERG
ncbi:MAG TPA: class I SAM-dependent methyltransferase [Kofleriaceae bacterium]|nr:class I SAM-dependent methyltransferase [Kofleriaceae bacterium]